MAAAWYVQAVAASHTDRYSIVDPTMALSAYKYEDRARFQHDRTRYAPSRVSHDMKRFVEVPMRRPFAIHRDTGDRQLSVVRLSDGPVPWATARQRAAPSALQSAAEGCLSL